jgi:acetyl-CoA acetyltransferase
MSWAGVDPSIMGTGPVPAAKKALHKAELINMMILISGKLMKRSQWLH